MPIVAIGLGTNVGDRERNLRSALLELGRFVRLDRASSLYETAPMYVEDQPPFLNAAAIGWADAGPLALLGGLKGIERALGRGERNRYGPREIDLDLLAYGCLRLDSDRGEGSRLQVPHPRIPERRFVLAPLAEIAPDLVLPGLGRVEELLLGTFAQSASVVKVADAALSLHGDFR